jgi:pimeloyl-ACP methyl ester carboxylesterase
VDSPRTPELNFHSANGLDIAVWHWPGSGPPLVFAHATGFHGRLWDRIVRLLPGRRALAVDARGHGRSGKPAPPYRWPAFGADLAALAEALDLRDAIGIGHSMGGHAVACAALLRPPTFRALLLVDPTIFPPSQFGVGRSLDTAFTLRRRAVWQSSAQMIERFHNRAPFASWKPEILRDYCEYALLPRDGAMALACSPEVEASIYQNSIEPDADIHRQVAHIAQPAVVLRAGVQRVPGVFNLSASPTDPELAWRLPRGRDIVLAGHSHYIPMECPERVAAEIQALEVLGESA